MDSEICLKKRHGRPRKSKTKVEFDDWETSIEVLEELDDNGNDLEAMVSKISKKKSSWKTQETLFTNY